MGFNFFKISKGLVRSFDGIAGSQSNKQKVKLSLTIKTFEENNPRPIETTTEITTYGLVTDLTQQSLKYLNFSIEEGRRTLSLRILNKTDILTKINQENLNNLKNNSSWFEWLGERYTIIGWKDYINHNAIRFYGVYGGQNTRDE